MEKKDRNVQKPVCYEKRETIPEVYSGVPTFLGVPRISESEIENCDVVVMGAPWEGVCTTGSFTGVELATKTIRQVSLRYGGYLPEFGYDFFDHLSVGDMGDSAMFNGDAERTFESIEKMVSAVHAKGRKSVLFGGDHSVSIPTIKALAGIGKKIGIVHFDAHLDNLPAFQGKETTARCSPFYRAYETPEVTAIAHIGIRGPRNHPTGVGNAEKHGAKIFTAAEIHAHGWEKIAKEVKEFVWSKADLIYLTVCSDALDVSTNPGGPADFGGLTSHQFLQMVHSFASEGIDAFDFVEVYPPQDLNGISSHMAAWAAVYAMNGMARKFVK